MFWTIMWSGSIYTTCTKFKEAIHIYRVLTPWGNTYVLAHTHTHAHTHQTYILITVQVFKPIYNVGTQHSQLLQWIVSINGLCLAE